MISVDEILIPTNIIFQKEYNLKKLLKDLGNPQNNFEVVNVVGTNGKGSTAQFIFNGLKTKYKKVGFFISPAFIYHNERIQFNNEMIFDDELKKMLKENEETIKKYKLTFFEIWTFLAILYFNKMKIDIAVIEAGIGGFKDATAVFENQKAVCVTSLGIDHAEILGKTIEEIIFQKFGIAKKGVKIFISEDNLKFEKIISKVNDNEKIFTKKINDNIYFQEFNKGLAREVLNYFGITNNEFGDAPLGRFTILKNNPYLILDGCHNVDGALKLSQQINKIDDLIILFGSSEGKYQEEILNILKKQSDEIYITEFDNYKSWKIDRDKFSEFPIVEDWKEFLEKNKNRNVIVCGSLYFVPIVYQWFMRN